jgi:uncharacterized protein HemX
MEAEALQRDDATVLHNPEAQTFLDASIKKRKRDQTTRIIVSFALVLLVIGIGGAAWVAWEQQQLAAQQEEERARQQRQTEALSLATLASSREIQDEKVIVALAAYRLDSTTPETRRLASEVLSSYYLREEFASATLSSAQMVSMYLLVSAVQISVYGIQLLEKSYTHSQNLAIVITA